MTLTEYVKRRLNIPHNYTLYDEMIEYHVEIMPVRCVIEMMEPYVAQVHQTHANVLY